jgi:hypothetical protein
MLVFEIENISSMRPWSINNYYLLITDLGVLKRYSLSVLLPLKFPDSTITSKVFL